MLASQQSACSLPPQFSMSRDSNKVEVAGKSSKIVAALMGGGALLSVGPGVERFDCGKAVGKETR